MPELKGILELIDFFFLKAWKLKTRKKMLWSIPYDTVKRFPPWFSPGCGVGASWEAQFLRVLKARDFAKFRFGSCLCNFPCVFNYLYEYIIYIRLELVLLVSKQELFIGYEALPVPTFQSMFFCIVNLLLDFSLAPPPFPAACGGT